MQYALAVFTLYILSSHYFHLGITNEIQNLFIYPPDYAKADAPRHNDTGEAICVIKIHLEMWAINSLSLEKQDLEVDLTISVMWQDYRLTLHPNSSSRLWPVVDETEVKQIWTPTLLFRNCKGCSPMYLSKSEELYVNRETGNILGQFRVLHKFTCAIDLRAYPMDNQFCQLQIYTYEDTNDAIQLQHLYPDMPLNIDSNLTLAEYRINPITKTRCVFQDFEGDVFSCLELSIRLEHLVTYHLMTAYAPTTFIVILSWISFWLPVSLAPARVALGLTSLLTLATRLDQAQKNLPPVAYVKAIDVWMFACIFLVSSSLCEFAVSHYREELGKTKPKLDLRIIRVLPEGVKENKLVSRITSFGPPPHARTYVGTPLDHMSRIVFPVSFFLFNIVYWSFYLTYYV